MTLPEPCHPPFWTPFRLGVPQIRRVGEVLADRDAAVALIRGGGDVAAPTVVFDGCINHALPEPAACRRVLGALRPVAAVRAAVDEFRHRQLAGRPDKLA